MEFLFLSAPVVIVCQLQLGMWKISCGLGKDYWKDLWADENDSVQHGGHYLMLPMVCLKMKIISEELKYSH